MALSYLPWTVFWTVFPGPDRGRKGCKFAAAPAAFPPNFTAIATPLPPSRSPAFVKPAVPNLRPPSLLAALLAASMLGLAACSGDYSPNTYAAAAAQQANTVTRGVIIGVRPVMITPDGTVGAVAGGAAGGVAGSQAPGGAVASAFGAIGGSLIGGIAGSAAQRATEDTKAWEYIVQQTDGKLVSVTQTDRTPLAIGTHVLVIAGKQARVVRDYTVALPAPPPKAATATEPAPAPIIVMPLAPSSASAPAAPAQAAAADAQPPQGAAPAATQEAAPGAGQNASGTPSPDSSSAPPQTPSSSASPATPAPSAP